MRLEFVVTTPDQQKRSSRGAFSLSKANQHKAKHGHAKLRARRRDMLLKALEYPRDTATESASQSAFETNIANTPSKLTDSSASRQHGEYTPDRRGLIRYARDGSHDDLVGDCTFQYYTEPIFFGKLQWLSSREMDNLTRYLQIVPSLAMGATLNHKYQPLRDLFSYSIQASPAVVDWLLLEAEGIRSLSDPSIRPTMHARRSRIYRKMSKMLADPATSCSTEVLDMVFAATCIEHRMGNGMGVSAVRIHCKGLYDLIEGHGGLASLFGVATTLSHPIFCLQYFQLSELEVSNRQEAQHCCESFLETLQDIQMSVISRGCSMILSRCPHDVKGMGNSAHQNVSESSVIAQNSYASMKHIVHRRRQDNSIAERISQFLSLYLIALMISDFGTIDALIHKFLSKLSMLVEDRINPTTGAKQLHTHVLTWMVGTAWVDVDASSSWPGSGPHKEIWITQAGLNALKVFTRLPDARKDDLTNLLADWLCAGRGDEMHDFSTVCEYVRQPLRPKYLFQIIAECCSDWYEQQIALEHHGLDHNRNAH